MNGAASTDPSRRLERRSHLLRAARAAALVVYAVLIAVGALVYPASMMFGAAMGLGGYWFVVSLLRRVGDDFPSLPHPVLAAAAAWGFPVALSGSSVTGLWGALAVGLLVVEAAVLFVHWIGADAPVPPKDQMREVLTAMPTERLLDEWEATQSRLAARNRDPLGEVCLRDLLIEELRSRDPVGTARWLSEGPADLPDLYIRPDSGPGN